MAGKKLMIGLCIMLFLAAAFASAEGVWKNAGEIEGGDWLLDSNGEWIQINSVSEVSLDYAVSVYNLEAGGFHTYFVSLLEILVHNKPVYINDNIDIPLSRTHEFSGNAWNAKIKKLKGGSSKTIVEVNSIKEADILLKEVFPDAVKIKGAGPRNVVDFNDFKGKNIYKKDYLVDPSTGGIYHHSAGTAHANIKHINIISPDGRKLTITIKPI